jgi:hypothetical protein
VKQIKITRNSSEGQDKNNTNNWKNKAKLRGEENVRLRKRIKELTESRDSWKKKYKEERQAGLKSVLIEGEKASRHQYSLLVISLILELQKYGGMSLRSCRHCIGCMLISLGLSSRLPSHNSIRNWLCKSGFHRIEKSKSLCGNYVLYADESIVFGSEKLLLIIGVEEKNIPIERSLSHSDMEVLYVGASVEWKGETIEEEIKKISENKTISYIVSDEGNNLRKAYKSLNYTHIEDCTHIFANDLKRLYEKDEDFEAFRKRIGALRRAWNLSKDKSQYMPPTMRGKMRFANIFPCVAWAKKSLEHWANLSEEVQIELSFLKEKTALINSLIEISVVFKMVCEKLKNEGFGAVQKHTILAELEGLKGEQKTNIFIENCKTYLENLTKKSHTLGQTHLLCSSDIIESYFGKFKTKINSNNPSGLTEFIFTIANFSQPFSIQEVKNALENVKLKDLKFSKK